MTVMPAMDACVPWPRHTILEEVVVDPNRQFTKLVMHHSHHRNFLLVDIYIVFQNEVFDD
jgi:hypothetical protein